MTLNDGISPAISIDKNNDQPSLARRRCRFTAPARFASRRDAEQTPERRAFHVAGGRACGSMAQAIAHGAQFADAGVEFVSFAGQKLAVDLRAAIRAEHVRDFVE